MTRTPARFDMRRETSAPNGGESLPDPTHTPTHTRPLRLLFSDGALSDVAAVWWPRSQNLSIELHDLVDGVTPRIGPVTRIHFEWNAVSALQRHIDPEDGLEVADPEPGQPSRVMRIYGRGGRRLDVAVVEPGVDTAYGYRAMTRILPSPTAATTRGDHHRAGRMAGSRHGTHLEPRR